MYHPTTAAKTFKKMRRTLTQKIQDIRKTYKKAVDELYENLNEESD